MKPDPREMIDHDDPDVIALALAAVEALPDATALLVLADRLQEVEEVEEVDREQKARRLAAVVGQVPPRWTGFGPRSADLVSRHLAAGDLRLALWLVLHRVAGSAPSVRLAALAPLGLARPGRAAAALRAIDPREPDPVDWGLPMRWAAEARNCVRAAAELLLDHAADADPGAAAEALGATARAHQLFTGHAPETAARAVRQAFGGCIKIVTGRDPVDLARELRRAARRSAMEFIHRALDPGPVSW